MTKTLPEHHPPRREKLTHWVRAHSPANDPPFTFWHGLLLLVGIVLFLAQQQTTGLVADISSYPVADWQIGIYGRLTALFLAGVALFLVRAMHPLMYVALIVESALLMLRIGELRMTHEPLTISYTLFLVFCGIVSVRVITRPNEYEVARAVSTARETALAEQLDEAHAEIRRLKGDA